MGYTTDFIGEFELNEALDEETYNLLVGLNNTRRMKRNVDSKYGIDGEFYVESTEDHGQKHEENIVNYNTPPRTQPGLWCGWVPTEDRLSIEWDGGEKFYNYVEWIEYIIDKILKPRGYVLSGIVKWIGEDYDDRGQIVITNNKVKIKEGKIVFE